MLLAEEACYEFLAWLDALDIDPASRRAAAPDLGVLLWEWLEEEGVDHVVGDYRVFLQTVTLILSRPFVDGAARGFEVKVGGIRKPLAVAESMSHWASYLIEDKFRELVYRRRFAKTASDHVVI